MSGAFASDKVVELENLDVSQFAQGAVHRAALRLVTDPLGNPVRVPLMIARGPHPGPVFGVTAAVHGNEVNGIPIIQRLFREIDVRSLHGTLVGVPVVSVFAFAESRRTFGEGFDLNRIMPGDPEGNVGEVYAHRFLTLLVERLDYLVDLHTASFGRVNSLYVRADLRHEPSRMMALLQAPQIIVHNEARDGTLRDAAMERGIAAITVEVGDPLRFQKRLIHDSVDGLRSVLQYAGMLDRADKPEDDEPVICGRSYWIFARQGGLLDVLPLPASRVDKGELIARVRNVFGDELATYRAPETSVIVGRSTNPICATGSRVVHLGVPSTLEAILHPKPSDGAHSPGDDREPEVL